MSVWSLLWFVVVLGMIPLALWMVQRSSLGRRLAGQARPAARVLGSTVIGPQQRLLSIEVGEGAARRWVLLGVTPQHITSLVESDQPLELPPPAAAPPEAFSSVLARWRPGRP